MLPMDQELSNDRASIIAKHHMKALLYGKFSYEAVETLHQLAGNTGIIAASRAEIDDSAPSTQPLA